MRCLGLLLGLCLLFAGAVPKRVERLEKRQADAVTAVNVLAKVASRRDDGTLSLDAFAPPDARVHRALPHHVVDVLVPTPPARWRDVHLSCDARGPPQAEES